MARREVKEWVLNIAFNRWQFNRPKHVGRLAEAIRACSPKTPEEWEQYYYEQVPQKHVDQNWQMLGDDMREHLQEIGRRLYAKISEQLKAEVEAITEEDCIAYVQEVVIRRTFDGYLTEKRTVYEQLSQTLHTKLEPAPDEWDRKYNVDFYIPVSDKAVGIQIKPITFTQMPETQKWYERMRQSHNRFREEQGGKVFVIFTATEQDGSKRIVNPEVIEEIQAEIERLSQSAEP